jgi:hypothetical protein
VRFPSRRADQMFVNRGSLPASRHSVVHLLPSCRRSPTMGNGVTRMDIHIRLIMLQPLVALIAGVLILLMPRLLNFIVAIYLIIIGIAGLYPHLMQ